MRVSKRVEIDITKETVIRTGVIKHLVIVGVMLLGLYPILELTRFLLACMSEVSEGSYNILGISSLYVAELAVMWFLYLMIPVVLYFYLRAR